MLIPLSLAVIGTGYFIAANNSAEAAQRQYMQLTVYLLLANADINHNGELVMGPLIEEPRLANPQSKFYAVVSNEQGDVYWRSASSVAVSLPQLATDLQLVPFGSDAFSMGIDDMSHYRRPVLWEMGNGDQVKLVFHVLEDGNWVSQQLEENQGILRASYVLTTVLLLAVLLFIVRWGLQPLSALVNQLQRVEDGMSDHIVGRYPSELQDLVGAINRLLENEQKQRERYRNALSDLSHSLKNPLSVLRNDINTLTGEARTSADNAIARMQEIIDFQMQRASIQSIDSVVKQRVNLYELAERVVRGLQKVYAERDLDIGLRGEAAWLSGDKRDLIELLGNLADNACKAATDKVRITITARQGEVLLSVEDDGPGVEASMLEQITQRGQRADQYKSGHGIGLAMVADIVANMRASMTLQQSEWGGARFDVVIPCPRQINL